MGAWWMKCRENVDAVKQRSRRCSSLFVMTFGLELQTSVAPVCPAGDPCRPKCSQYPPFDLAIRRGQEQQVSTPPRASRELAFVRVSA